MATIVVVKESLLTFIAERNLEEDIIDKREIYSEFIELLDIELATESSLQLTPVPAKMPYTAVERMTRQLVQQLQALEARGYTLFFWQGADILLVNEEYYLLANLTQLVPIKYKQLVLNYPTVYPFPSAVCAPELLKMAALPFITHKSASYYSLALLCLSKLNLSLETLQGTKLYYFLERCLKEEPSERYLYYIH
jgi:hypothetical protein